MIAHRARHCNTAELRDRLDARRHVHAVAIDVIVLDDDITEIYADPELDPPGI